MRLEHFTDATKFVDLENEFLWEDEFGWSANAKESEYSVTGALIVDQQTRQAGRPITLVPPNENQGWLPRSAVETLHAWAQIPDLVLKLTFANASVFKVIFAPNEEQVIEAEPVKGFQSPAPTDWFRATIKLIEYTE